MTRTPALATLALGLLVANLVAFPNTLSALDADAKVTELREAASCACDTTTGTSASASAKKKERGPSPMGQGGHIRMEPDVECPSGCNTQVWTWQYCLKEPDTTCDLWTHGFTVYFCTGVTYFNCDGYSWVDTNTT